jgi:hypothetical protein
MIEQQCILRVSLSKNGIECGNRRSKSEFYYGDTI